MADEGLNPWSEKHWQRIRENEEYDAIAAATVLPNTVLEHPDFQTLVEEEYGGSPQDAMAALSPLSEWLEARDGLEPVYEAVADA